MLSQSSSNEALDFARKHIVKYDIIVKVLCRKDYIIAVVCLSLLFIFLFFCYK